MIMGNKFRNIAFCAATAFACLGMISCGGAKKTAGYNYPNGKPNMGITSTSKVDTVRWKEDRNAKLPIYSSGNLQDSHYPPNNPGNGGVIIDNKGTYVPATPTDLKSSYNLAVLLPFFTDKASPDSIYSKASFALDFYAGTKIALDSLSHTDANLTVTTLDSKTNFYDLLNRYEVSHADLVLGPVEKDNISAAAAFSTSRGITLISPYDPTGDLPDNNPNFVQVKPSFKTHCEALTKSVRAKYTPEQVILVGRSKDNESARFKLFQDANNDFEKTSHSIHFGEWVIDDETSFNVNDYLNASKVTVFILPSWNEAFVTAFLKQLDASPHRSRTVVYGMPQWMDISGMNPLYERLGVHISSSTYIDPESPNVKDFRKKFFDKFAKLPNNYSFLGYDCTLYFVEEMKKYGTKFPAFLEQDPRKVLHTQFSFSPVFKAGTDNFSIPMKYENKFVNILKYSNGAFRPDEY